MDAAARAAAHYAFVKAYAILMLVIAVDAPGARGAGQRRSRVAEDEFEQPEPAPRARDRGAPGTDAAVSGEGKSDPEAQPVDNTLRDRHEKRARAAVTHPRLAQICQGPRHPRAAARRDGGHRRSSGLVGHDRRAARPREHRGGPAHRAGAPAAAAFSKTWAMVEPKGEAKGCARFEESRRIPACGHAARSGCARSDQPVANAGHVQREGEVRLRVEYGAELASDCRHRSSRIRAGDPRAHLPALRARQRGAGAARAGNGVGLTINGNPHCGLMGGESASSAPAKAALQRAGVPARARIARGGGQVAVDGLWAI